MNKRILVPLTLALLMAACDPATATPTTTPKPAATETAAPATSEPAATPLPPTAVPNPTGVTLVLPPTLAQSVQANPQAAVPKTDAPAFGGAAPHHILVSFDQDPTPEGVRARQVRVYPLEGLRAIDPSVAKEIDALQTLLNTRPENVTGTLPLLPIQPAAQVFHAQLKYIDFANGSGVRYISKYAQDVSPITNEDVFYTFQGLTGDGKYYVAAFYPISSTVLPNSFDESPAKQNPDLLSDAAKYEKYLADAMLGLNGLPSDQFIPDLSILDSLLQSLNAQPVLPDTQAAAPAVLSSPTTQTVKATTVATTTVEATATEVAPTDLTANTVTNADAKPLGTARARSVVNVRAQASTRSTVLAQLRRNEEVVVLGRDASGKWLFVQFDENKRGWINAPFLRTTLRVRTLPVVK